MPETSESPISAAGNPSRRTVLGIAAATAAAAAAPLVGDVPAAQAASKAAVKETVKETAKVPEELVFISTWKGTQIYGAWFDPEHGDMTLIGPVGAAVSNWATMHPVKPVLYVGGGQDGGFVYSYDFDPATGLLTQTGTVRTDPGGTAGGGVSYLMVDSPSKTILVANFEAGLTAAVPIEQGVMGEPVSIVQDTGSGPNARQLSPHPHYVAVDPTGRYALVPDFGADRIFVYRFDRRTRALSASEVNGTGYYQTDPGSGPRRVLFHSGGRTLYTLNELTATIEILDWDPAAEKLTRRQILSTDTPDFTGTKSGAELALGADGRFLYTSNRGENALVVYRIDERTELLEEVQRIPCAGQVPWSFTIHRTGRWLFVANEMSNTVNLFSVDRASGKLTDTGRPVPVPNPDCITFYYR